jgi:hypothetical protein
MPSTPFSPKKESRSYSGSSARSAAAAREHAAGVQLGRDLAQAGRLAVADVRERRREVVGIGVCVGRDRRREHHAALSGPLERRRSTTSSSAMQTLVSHTRNR